jgi:hypothetical protein
MYNPMRVDAAVEASQRSHTLLRQLLNIADGQVPAGMSIVEAIAAQFTSINNFSIDDATEFYACLVYGTVTITAKDLLGYFDRLNGVAGPIPAATRGRLTWPT